MGCLERVGRMADPPPRWRHATLASASLALLPLLLEALGTMRGPHPLPWERQVQQDYKEPLPSSASTQAETFSQSQSFILETSPPHPRTPTGAAESVAGVGGGGWDDRAVCVLLVWDRRESGWTLALGCFRVSPSGTRVHLQRSPSPNPTFNGALGFCSVELTFMVTHAFWKTAGQARRDSWQEALPANMLPGQLPSLPGRWACSLLGK